MRFRYKSVLKVLAVASLMMSSCEGFLKEEPFESQTELNAFKSVEDVEKALIGAYNTLTDFDGDYLHYSMTIPEMMADNLYNTPSTGGGTVLIFGNFNFSVASGGLENAWLNGYTLIDRVNFTLAKLALFEGTNEGLEAKIKGEALVLRAMGHFDLLKNFGVSMERNFNEADSGIPVMLASEISSPARNTVKEVYDQIFKDLEQAVLLLDGKNTGDVFRFNANTARALAARVALYAGDYENAAKYADAVIDSKATMLSDINSFSSIWEIGDHSDEVLFKVFAKDGDSYFSGYFAPNTAGILKRPSPELFDLYEEADVRKGAYLMDDADLGQVVVKYKGEAENEQRSIEVIRMGEIYLISAEANFRIGNTAEALESFNALRSNRIEGVTDVTTLDEDMILEERRRELAFEGHRFYDLKRLGLNLDRTAMADQPKVTVDALPAGSKYWIFPIPNRELVVNSNLKQSSKWQ
ncbi:RagB/SusD family nutrient uptake outer membrane protein [Limibacter armeniacum]|uniref:RagB/SusD family nutrient uptake outer membrane protein n=1 Tax=Limibacter armeniacum TaxID=466084 RepID=UPI002FE5CCCC